MKPQAIAIGDCNTDITKAKMHGYVLKWSFDRVIGMAIDLCEEINNETCSYL